jgi:putative N6-adenine-specific DNA methylase
VTDPHVPPPRPSSQRREIFFAVCAPGLEPLLHAEVRALRLARSESQVGGVHFEGTLRDAWRANLHLRTAVRVLWRVGRFEAPSEQALYDGVRALEWERFVSCGGTLAVSAHVKDSKLRHSAYVAQKTKDAIADRFRDREGRRPSVDKESPDLLVHVHLSHDRSTVSIDTSGESLHKRGWRRFQGRAPLAETLAAAVVLWSGWDRRSPLIDPFCGSGTILIEAGLLAAGVPPGIFRPLFAFERLPDHDARAWEVLREEARGAVRASPKLILRGWDADPQAVSGARENVRAAGLEDLVDIEVEASEAAAIEYRRGWNAWIVTNPPYGKRVGSERDLESLLARFAATLRSRCGGYHLTLLSGSEASTRALGFEAAERRRFINGALECELVRIEIPR